MPKVKTAVSLQKSLVERLDKLARERHVSRSQLFSRAADEFLRRHEAPALLEAINRALEDDPQTEERARVRAMREWPQERLIEKTVTYTLEVNGRFFVIKNVPARVNEETGEQFFSPQTVERLQEIIEGAERPVRVIETPVFDYAA